MRPTIRCAKLGLERGLAGPLEAPAAFYMKSPPRHYRHSAAFEMCDAFIRGEEAEYSRPELSGHSIAGE